MWIANQIVLCISAFVILSDGQQVNQSANKVKVAVYFESLCPDSENFITNQLYPNWEDIKDYIEIRFIPFGKSSSLENGRKFACQHGSKECKGNRIISCALNIIPTQDLQVEYLRCFMNVYKYTIIDDNENGQKCYQLLNLNLDEMMGTCFQTRNGTDLQLRAETDTKAVSPRFIPTIVFNGVFNQQLQDESITNFRETVCRLIHYYNVGDCTYRPSI